MFKFVRYSNYLSKKNAIVNLRNQNDTLKEDNLKLVERNNNLQFENKKHNNINKQNIKELNDYKLLVEIKKNAYNNIISDYNKELKRNQELSDYQTKYNQTVQTLNNLKLHKKELQLETKKLLDTKNDLVKTNNSLTSNNTKLEDELKKYKEMYNTLNTEYMNYKEETMKQSYKELDKRMKKALKKHDDSKNPFKLLDKHFKKTFKIKK